MDQTDIQEVYASTASWFHRLEAADRALLGRFRARHFGDIDGRILDVACGTGTNFPYLAPNAEVIGVDLSSDMLEHAANRLKDLPIDGSVMQMDAQQLAFSDNQFETVISALATCTFPDPIKAIEEMERVCRPGGTIRLLEHGRSSVGILETIQHWVDDVHYRHMGCRWTQSPREHVLDADISIQTINSSFLGMITEMTLTPTATQIT